jgi:hypothetical protein
MTESFDPEILISEEYLKALEGGNMYKDRPIVYVSFNDGDPDIYARLIEETPEQVQRWITPEGAKTVHISKIILLYYMRPYSCSCQCYSPWGDVVGKEPNRIQSLRTLN